jgi:hypothetical protein
MTPFLGQTLVALAGCKSPADYYRVQIDFQKHATPADVAFLAQMPPAWPAEFDAWLRGLFAMMTLNRGDIAGFRLSPVNEHVSLYAGATKAATLVIGFCGVAELLFMPIPCILQYFVPGTSDVLVLRDPSKTGFISGIRGYSTSFRDLIDRLRRDADVSSYRDTRTFGASGGGAAALAAGVLLRSMRAVSFSGHLPSVSQRYAADAAAADLETVLRSAGPHGEYTCVYGGRNQRDANNAIDLSRGLRARLSPVGEVSDHNVIFELHKKRALAALLKDVGLT